MSHDHDFFYEGGGRREAVDALFEGIHVAGAVVMLVGEAGSGRTAVLDRFCSEVDPDVLAVARVHGDILMSGTQCLSACADALARESAAETPPLTLPEAVEHVRRSGRMPVFVIDDAHDLGEQPRSDVALFCREHAVPLVLAGDRVLLAGDGESTDVIALRAFSPAESEDFIAAWLAVDDEDEMPSHRAVEKLHRQAEGMPGRLAILLAAGGAARNTWFPAGFPVWHVVFTVGAGSLLLVLLAVFLQKSPAPAAAPKESPEVAVPLPIPDEAIRATPQPSGAAPGNRLSAAAVPRPLDVKALPDAATTPGAPAAAGPQPSAAIAPAADGAHGIPVALPPPVAPVPPAVAPAVPSKASAAAARPVAPPAAAAPKPAPARHYSADEEALLKERATAFTLQLFASFNEQAVEQFRMRHAGMRILVFRTLRDDLPWYVAVTGSYRGRDEAKAAISRLPADIRQMKPWARGLHDIQDELRRRRN